MIEAVNSVVSNAAVLRASAQQVDAVSTVVAAQPRQGSDYERPEAPQAPYISPYIALDLNFDKAVVQIRDSETGDVVDQFPSESRMAENLRSQAQAEQTPKLSSASVSTSQETSSNQVQAEVKEVRARPQSEVSSQNASVASAPDISSSIATAQLASTALSVAAQSGQQASVSNVSVDA